MDTIVVIIISIVKLIFDSIFSLLITYLVILLSIRIFKIWKIKEVNGKPICPKCGAKCSRTNKEKLDVFRNYFSLKLMRWKRFNCLSCNWEGSRW